jgi:hypothetical protein
MEKKIILKIKICIYCPHIFLVEGSGFSLSSMSVLGTSLAFLIWVLSFSDRGFLWIPASL